MRSKFFSFGLPVLVLLSASSFTLAHAAGPVAGGSAGGAGEDVRVLSRDALGVPDLITGDLGRLPPGKVEDAAVRFLQGFSARRLSASGGESFVPRRVIEDELGQVHVRAQQLLNGLPVVGGELIVHSDRASRRVLAVNGRFVVDNGEPSKPEISAERALALAYVDAGFFQPELAGPPELTYIVDPHTQAPRLAWSALVRSEGEDGPGLDRIFADALVGGLVDLQTQVHTALNRRTHTANNTTTLPGTLLITEGGSSTDNVAQTAHNNAGTTYNYYFTRHGRDSLDGSGMNIVSTVHYGNNVNNAAWRSDLLQIWYGDGNGTQYSPLGGALDVVAHELTHGVTQFESNLVYNREPGALNESLSDVFGAATEAFAQGVNANTWLIGEAVYTPGTAGDALRYMNNPTRDGSSKDFYPERLYPGTCTPSTANDQCGVHSNSGIANLAFYLLSQGGFHPRRKSERGINGIGIVNAAAIFYRAQTTYLTSTSNFANIKTLTRTAANDLFGAASEQARHTTQAWCMVGIGGTDCLIELTATGTTFAGKRWATLNWKYAASANVDVFRDGVLVLTTPNDGGQVHSVPYAGSEPTANYWVCEAGSTTWYDSNTCSNVVTVYF